MCRKRLSSSSNSQSWRASCKTLHDVGLDYIKLGRAQPRSVEARPQRIKLAKELSRVATGRTAYILDEPTTGLHFATSSVCSMCCTVWSMR